MFYFISSSTTALKIFFTFLGSSYFITQPSRIVRSASHRMPTPEQPYPCSIGPIGNLSQSESEILRCDFVESSIVAQCSTRKDSFAIGRTLQLQNLFRQTLDFPCMQINYPVILIVYYESWGFSRKVKNLPIFRLKLLPTSSGPIGGNKKKSVKRVYCRLSRAFYCQSLKLANGFALNGGTIGYTETNNSGQRKWWK